MKKLLLLSTSLTACTFLACIPQHVALANPEGGVISAGSATIETGATRVDVRQSSDKAVIDWRSFNINKGETTQFHQPTSSSLTVNRINDSNPSQILGNLKSNGNIVLINQSGISFGKEAIVDVGGLIATTSDIGNDDAMAGRMNFIATGNATATINNAGTITAKDAGLVGLVAPNVENSGVINAKLGKVHLASGDKFTLDLYGDGAISVQASDALESQIISNTGSISAEGGTIQVSAATGAHLVNSLVQIDGELSAPSASIGDGGKIIIAGDEASSVSITGILDASGTNGGSISISGKNVLQQGKLLANATNGQGGTINVNFKEAYLDNEASSAQAKSTNGNGGSINIKGKQGSRAFVSGTYDASSDSQRGGTVKLTAADGDLKLFGAHVSADGATGGGTVQVGGEFQGGGTLEHSKTTAVNYSTVLSADATQAGKGGEVIVWSDEETLFGGTAQARGGIYGGSGGQIEISSKDTMKIAGNAVTTAAARMDGFLAGNLLLDPKNITIETGGIAGGISYFEFVDPNPDAGDFGVGFSGNGTTLLSNGNVVITDYLDDLQASNSGAVYLFNGVTGALISTFTGSKANDQVGLNGVTELSNGNFVILSGEWGNGATAQAGAVTWANGTTGISGIVTSANSMVGNHSGDQIGGWGIWTLDNGNYIIRGTRWNSNRGAATWGNGLGGTVGIVSSANSIVGSKANDYVGDHVTVLENDNYVVISPLWDNGATLNVGAVTWGNGSTGTSGVVSSANSLIGSTTNDYVGGDQWGNVQLVALDNGNYYVGSTAWNNGATVDAGALTWGNGLGGTVGVVSSANSLVGSSTNDHVGNLGGDADVLIALSNGNYVIRNADWDNSGAGATDAGAITWLGDATSAITGTVSAANSLVGSSTNDRLGGWAVSHVIPLSNGNYLVVDPEWDNVGIADAGSITWVDGTVGITGTISAANSLIGSSAGDMLGSDSVYELTNGNYVVVSSGWDNGGITDAGAVTWGSGTSSITGTISAANSLIGTSANDLVGSAGITTLSNGNYIISSPTWNNGIITEAGASTWANGATGITGVVSTANSLYGSTNGDHVGAGATEISGNTYVVLSSDWNNGLLTNAGAVTLASTVTGLTGAVTTANSFVGTSSGAFVGSGGVTSVGTGKFIIISPDWNDGIGTSLGAVTWIDPSVTTSGAVSVTNSLIGSTNSDQVGSDGVYVLSNGNYIIGSPNWDNGAFTDAGAATWANGNTGLFGVLSSSNSLVGGNSGDAISARVSDWEGVELPSGNVIIINTGWNNGAGAVTWIDGDLGSTGVIGASNSVIGSHAGDWLGWRDWDQPVLSNGDYALHAAFWDGGTGAFTIIDGEHGSFGEITPYNGIIGIGGMWPNYRDNDDEINGRYIVTDGAGKVYSIDYLNQDNIGDYNSFSDLPSSNVTFDPGFLTNVLNAGTSVTLQANNDITLNDDLIVNNTGGNGGTLTFQAGRSILLNADIYTDNGDLNLFANEDLSTGVVNAQRDSGDAVITMGAGTSIDAGTGTVTIRLDDGTGKTYKTAGDITLRDLTAGTILARNMNAGKNIILQSGILTATDAGDAITLVSRQNFINNSGAGALVTPSGRWLIYTKSPSGNTLGGLIEDFSLYSCTYGGACPAMAANNGLLYSASLTSPSSTSDTPTLTTDIPETVDYMSLGGFLRDLQNDVSTQLGPEIFSTPTLSQDEANLTDEAQMDLSYTTVQGAVNAEKDANGSYISMHPWLKEFLSNPFAMLEE